MIHAFGCGRSPCPLLLVRFFKVVLEGYLYMYLSIFACLLCYFSDISVNKTRQVLGRPVCDRGVIPRTLVQSNVVRSRLIILINEEINEANWMVSNSAKLDHRTKQHTQFGVSASNGSRDMARTKSWRKKRKKLKIKKK